MKSEESKAYRPSFGGLHTKTTRKVARGVLLISTLFALGCGKPERKVPEGERPLHVVTTTTILTDLAREIGGQDVHVVGIMKPGGDPHLYRPTPRDAQAIANADLVLTNGLKLEGWIDDLVRNAGGGAKVVVASKSVKHLSDPSKTNYPDPHFWHDPTLWSIAADNVTASFVETDKVHKADFEKRRDAYKTELAALDKTLEGALSTVPKDKRYLVTSHDAFQYFGKRYGLNVVAVQGISTESEAGSRDVARLVEVVKENQVPAVFVETSVNPKLLQQIATETGAKIGGTLYSDSLDAEGKPGGTYVGMMKANAKTVAEALGGNAAGL